MYKVGEFSKLSRITVKALRYYDQIGLFRPKHINEETGYRYYSINQLQSLYRIVELREYGFTISEIMELIDAEEKENPEKRIACFLEQKRSEIMDQIKEYERKLNQIDVYSNNLINEESSSSIVIKEIPELIVASISKKIFDYNVYNDMIGDIKRYLKKQKIRIGNPDYCFTIYHDCEYKEHDIDVELCQIVSKFGENQNNIVFKKIQKVNMAACILHSGSHNQLRKSYGTLLQWIEENNYEIVGALRECYLKWVSINRDLYTGERALVEIQAPIRKKND